MATQRGLIVEGPNQPFTVVDTIPRPPAPAAKQALVKSLVAGVNLMETYQQHTGLLVMEWPAVLGTDGCGVVLDVGEGCTKLKKGDYVFGCSRVGQNSYTPYQDTFLVDEDIIIKKSDNITLEEACTIGVGLETAALGLLAGTDLTLPSPGTKAEEKDEWIVVLGGSGTVGQFAVQIARLCGYKVLASASKSKADVPLSQGATATIDGRASVDEQIAEMKKITGGKFARIFDASTYGYDIMVKALETASTETQKYISSVDDWSPWNTPASLREYRTQLGQLGRLDTAIGSVVWKDLAGWIPTLEGHLAAGTIKPVEYQMPEGAGWEKLLEGIQDLEGGKAAKKIIVKIQDE